MVIPMRCGVRGNRIFDGRFSSREGVTSGSVRPSIGCKGGIGTLHRDAKTTTQGSGENTNSRVPSFLPGRVLRRFLKEVSCDAIGVVGGFRHQRTCIYGQSAPETMQVHSSHALCRFSKKRA